MKKLMLLAMIVFLLFGCLQQNNPIQEEQSVTFQLMKSADIDVASAMCIVSADDIDTLVAALTVTPISVSGAINDIPYGEDRLFEIKTYNSSGLMNYYGSTLIDINSIAPIVNIVLHPVDLTADVTIVGTFADDEETEEKIVFSANWSGSNDVYIMDIDGSNITQLTSSSFDDNYPILSPDRTKLTYHSWTDDGPVAYIMDIGSGEQSIIDLEGYRAHSFYWHPDREKFLFHSNYYGSADIFIYDVLEDTVLSVIRNSSTNWMPVYSNDGHSIVYYSNVSGTYKVYIADEDGSNIRRLNPESSGDERVPHMCPTDSNLVVFSAIGYGGDSGDWELYITDRSTGTVTDLIQSSNGKESWPKWSPDGEKIIYVGSSGSNSGIYIVNKDGTDNRQVLQTYDGNEYYPHWR